MELHSASRSAYAYFDRIEASAQAHADAMFEAAARAGLQFSAAESAIGPASAPDLLVEFDLAATRRPADLGDALLAGITHFLAGALATVIALSMPSLGAGSAGAAAIAGCALSAAWKDPNFD